MKSPIKSFARILTVAVLTVSLISPAIFSKEALAAQITARTLTLQTGATDGASEPGGVVDHLFSFTLPGGSNVGSIQFLYCTKAAGLFPGDCTTPTGLVTTTATLGSETGATGFSMVNTTNGSPYLTRTAAAVGVGQVVTYQLQTVTNPTNENETFFVRISTFISEDITGASTDTGSVAAATAEPIIIEGIMPESLVFCTGETIGLTAGVPDCLTATDGTIAFDQLFSPTDTASTQSQMLASTNAGAGYAISVNGPTLTSGSNTIAPMNAMALGVRGLSQFGLNLKANTIITTTNPRGIETAPLANATNYRGQPSAGYDTVDNFKYTTGNVIADSYNGGAGGTDAQIFTVSYIVNVPGSQPAGTYTTTLTYICTATY